MEITTKLHPNLMGRSSGFQVWEQAPGQNDWTERGEYIFMSSARSSRKTWEKRGHKVRIYSVDRHSGRLEYETA